MNVLTIHAKVAVFSPSGQDTSGKFVMADSDEVMKAVWPGQVEEPTLYASAAAVLDAAEIRFAVGQNWHGQNVLTCSRVGDERVEVTLGE